MPKMLGLVLCALAVAASACAAVGVPKNRVGTTAFVIEVDESTGSYVLRSLNPGRQVLQARIGAQLDHHWVFSNSYPRHTLERSAFSDAFGNGEELKVTNSGLAGQPDLICIFHQHSEPNFIEVQVEVRNHASMRVTVQTLRLLDADGGVIGDLGGPAEADRVLSDSFSEDRPNMAIHDLGGATNGMHRAVGSQLIYNRQSRESLFFGALTSERWLTVLRLHTEASPAKIASYEVDSEGTTELEKDNSLRTAPAENQIELSLPVAPGESLTSERLLISLGKDYHAQLETYGEIIRRLHQPRLAQPTPMGWWSWTAYYFGLSEDTALTNAQLLATHLKELGYRFFHIDEGYQYARGEYTTSNALVFPHGVRALENQVRGLGLTSGIWTAPFEVSERSWVYENHKDWLVHNAKGQPIHAGYVIEGEEPGHDLDRLYMLDTTHPGAQEYLRTTYTTLTRDWGIRYIKLDFMDDSAIEGYRFQPDTTALQAQRIGLRVIREAVGERVLLDKDGSPMLNPVGMVDTGRISCDTGHTFEASRDAAPGIAARYYMNRNFYTSDPDAFSISRQTVVEQEWHGGKRPLTLEEAQVAIALAAVTGGMYEIGDDLPTLFADADRMALLENRDLINMARYAHSARPLDLMSYAPEDEMPSVFLLHESRRQAILTVFNWTDKPRRHEFSWAELGTTGRQLTDVFDAATAVSVNAESVSLELPPRSVRMFKIVDSSIPAKAPSVSVQTPGSIETGKPVVFSARAEADGVPATLFRWDFGDGTGAEGSSVEHAYTRAGEFNVQLAIEGLEGPAYEKSFPVTASGSIDTVFRPERNRRYEQH